MSEPITAGGAAAPDAGATRLIGRLGSWTVAAMIVAAALAQQAAGHLNGDDSWFITFAEKVAQGAGAYVDVSDPNPPAGFLAYAPAVLAARRIGLSPEFWTVAEVVLLSFGSIALSGAILRASRLAAPEERGAWRNAALWVLLFAPAFGFAEREHFALIATLPFLAAMAARGESRAAPLGLALAAGLCGGAAMAFKPYYALPLGLVVLAACWRRRTLAPIVGPEGLAAAATVVAYWVFVWLRYPFYVYDVLPLAMEVYAPARYGFAQVLVSAPFVANLALLIAVGVGVRLLGIDWRAVVLALASAGFLATYAIQAKLWFNHAYPGVGLGILACVALATGRMARAREAAARFARFAVLPALAVSPFLGAVAMNLPGAEEHPGLTAAVRALAPPHPKIAALAEQLDYGHPLVRRLGGTWIGRDNALWVNNCVAQILATRRPGAEARARLEDYAAEERRRLAADIAQGRPDAILVESAEFLKWARSKPEFAHVLDGYVKAGQAGEVEIWTRAPTAGAGIR